MIRCTAVASAFCIAVTWQAAWLNSLNCIGYAIPTRFQSVPQIRSHVYEYFSLTFYNSFIDFRSLPCCISQLYLNNTTFFFFFFFFFLLLHLLPYVAICITINRKSFSSVFHLISMESFRDNLSLPSLTKEDLLSWSRMTLPLIPSSTGNDHSFAIRSIKATLYLLFYIRVDCASIAIFYIRLHLNWIK